MKGFFFNLVFCMKTNSVLLAVCGWMCAHLHAWLCLENIKAWRGQSIFWGCFGLDRISYLDIRCCTHSFVSRITKAFHSGAACQYFSVRAQPKVPAHTVWNSPIHQWLWMPRRWGLYWHPLPLISTLGFCWYGPDLVPQRRVSPVFSCECQNSEKENIWNRQTKGNQHRPGRSVGLSTGKM